MPQLQLVTLKQVLEVVLLSTPAYRKLDGLKLMLHDDLVPARYKLPSPVVLLASEANPGAYDVAKELKRCFPDAPGKPGVAITVTPPPHVAEMAESIMASRSSDSGKNLLTPSRVKRLRTDSASKRLGQQGGAALATPGRHKWAASGRRLIAAKAIKKTSFSFRRTNADESTSSIDMISGPQQHEPPPSPPPSPTSPPGRPAVSTSVPAEERGREGTIEVVARRSCRESSHGPAEAPEEAPAEAPAGAPASAKARVLAAAKVRVKAAAVELHLAHRTSVETDIGAANSSPAAFDELETTREATHLLLYLDTQARLERIPRDRSRPVSARLGTTPGTHGVRVGHRGTSTQPFASVMLVAWQTFANADERLQLSALLHAAMTSTPRLKIVLVHEMDEEARAGCSFGQIIKVRRACPDAIRATPRAASRQRRLTGARIMRSQNTPTALVKTGLYKPLATGLASGRAQREACLVMLAKTLGAKKRVSRFHGDA